jgi:hypothetical protein
MSRLWREPSWFACAAFFDIDNCELREFTNEQMAEIVTLILSCHVQVVGSADDASETDAQYHRKDLMRIRVWLLELCRTPDIDLPPQLAAISKGERGGALWRLLLQGVVQAPATVTSAVEKFAKTIRVFMSMQSSSAASERLFSAAKYVIDGRDSLDDTKFERDVIIRSYVQRRVTTEVDFDNLVKTIANVIEAARAEENQK